MTATVTVAAKKSRTRTQTCFHTPMRGKHPMVTIRNACAQKPAFVTCLARALQDIERQMHTAYIETPAQGMDSPKMTGKRSAQPAAGFGL